MMHLCSVVVGIYPHASETESSFIKQVGFADFYFGTKKYPAQDGASCNRCRFPAR